MQQDHQEYKLNRSISLDSPRRKLQAENLARARAQTHNNMISPAPGFYQTISSKTYSQRVVGGAFGNSVRPSIAQKDAKFEPGPLNYQPKLTAVRPHIQVTKILQASPTQKPRIQSRNVSQSAGVSKKNEQQKNKSNQDVWNSGLKKQTPTASKQ